MIVQPPNYSDPTLSTGYCAFHDYTLPGIEGGIYNHVEPRLADTNMPYVLAINSGGSTACGENGVNSGSAGKLDGFSIALGHEIEETVTDPGAENVTGSGLTRGQTPRLRAPGTAPGPGPAYPSPFPLSSEHAGRTR